MSKTIDEIVEPTRLFDTDTGMTVQLRADIESYAKEYAVAELEKVKDLIIDQNIGHHTESGNYGCIPLDSADFIDQAINRLKGQEGTK